MRDEEVRRPLFRSDPVAPREEAARRLLERGLAAAVVVALLLPLLARHPASLPSAGALLESLPVDVAGDPPWRLSLLPGLGPVRADAVVRDREANGPVVTLADLERVPGIGPKTIDALRAHGAVVATERRGTSGPASVASVASEEHARR